jgi:hypothetical protein
MGKREWAVGHVVEDMSVNCTRTSEGYCTIDEDIGSATCAFTSVLSPM